MNHNKCVKKSNDNDIDVSKNAGDFYVASPEECKIKCDSNQQCVAAQMVAGEKCTLWSATPSVEYYGDGNASSGSFCYVVYSPSECGRDFASIE